MSAGVVMNGPVHERGMFNIEAFDGRRWRGGMNRAKRDDAIAAAKRWSAENGMRYRVFAPEDGLVFDTAATPIDVLAVLDRVASRLRSPQRLSRTAQGKEVYAAQLDEARAAVVELRERLVASNWRLANLLALIPEGRPERAQIEQDMADNRAALARVGGAA